jgi:hypothetical protein
MVETRDRARGTEPNTFGGRMTDGIDTGLGWTVQGRLCVGIGSNRKMDRNICDYLWRCYFGCGDGERLGRTRANK